MFLAFEEVATSRVGKLRFGIHLVQIDVVWYMGHREGIRVASLSDMLGVILMISTARTITVLILDQLDGVSSIRLISPDSEFIR